MNEQNLQWERINHKWNDPYKLAGAAAVLALLLIITGIWFGKELTIGDENKLPWVLSSSTILLYSLFSTVGLLMTADMKRYWSRSLYGFIGLLAVVFVFCWLVTGISINAVGKFKSVLLVLIIAYAVLMSIGNSVRWIVRVTLEQDSKKLEKEKREQNKE